MARKTVQNDLTSPEKMARVNKDNISLTKEFLRYLKSINRENTRPIGTAKPQNI